MLIPLFASAARILRYRIEFAMDGSPPDFTWDALRAEGWTVLTDSHRDMDGHVQHLLDRVLNPDGVLIYRVSKGDDRVDQGYTNPNKQLWGEYTATVKRLIAKHAFDRPKYPGRGPV